ncbi:MAG: type II secretion system protein [Patescibacteria group bacterium]
MLIRLLRKNKGFTLVELMIVITVIAILATIGTMSFSRVQKQARDTKRKGDLRALATALQGYYTDNNNVYPATLAGLVPTYVPSTPIPPVPSLQASYAYVVDATSTLFTLCAVMETQLAADGPTWKVSTLNPGGTKTTTVAGSCVAE